MANKTTITLANIADSLATVSVGGTAYTIGSSTSSSVGTVADIGSFDWKVGTDIKFTADAALSGGISLANAVSSSVITGADFSKTTAGISFAAGSDTSVYTSLVKGGAGNDTISVTADAAFTVDAGAGDDLISISKGTDILTMGAGADTLNFTGGAVSVEDYNYYDGDVIKVATASLGSVSLGANGQMTVADATSIVSGKNGVAEQDGWYAAKLMDSSDSKTIVDYFTSSGNKGVVSLDLSKSKASTVNINTSLDGSATTANLTLGKGAANVTLAKGNDAADTIAVGKASNAGGVKTITNFGTEDVLSISSAKLSNVDFALERNNSDVVLTYAASTVSLVGIGADGGEAFYIDNGSKNKVVFAGSDSIISYAASSDANWFVGATDSSTTLEVGATTHLHETDKYKNINYIKVASDIDTSDNINLTGVRDKANTIDASAAKVGVGVWGYSTSADVITLGDGQDTVYFGTTDGADTISGFKFGSATDSDILYLYDTKELGDIKVVGNGSAASISSAGKKSTAASVAGADGKNDIALIQLADGNVYTVAGAYAKADVITVDNDQTKELNYYAFNADKKQKVVINGSNTFAFNTTYTDFYTTGANVATVDASGASGTVTLAGAANIVGGSGTNEIWTYKSDANATVTAGDGTDHIWFADGFDKSVVVKSFDSDDDSIKFALAGSLKDIAEGYSFKANSTDAVVTGTSGSKLTVEQNTEFNVSDGAGNTYKALVGTDSVAFADDVNIYGGMSTLTAGADIDGEVVVRVGKNSNGVASENYFIDDSVKVFDASKSAASFVIAGSSDHANTIKGGMSNNMLYGGGSSNDELVGSTEAADIFFFGTGDGKDVVSGGLDSADSVSLWNVDDADIANITVTLDEKAGTAKIALSDTSTLNFSDANAAQLIKDGLSFTSATNTAYKYDSETGKLVAKA